ncbi:MAG: hypothetical protein RIK87_16455 [Fuerstiella sp.]
MAISTLEKNSNLQHEHSRPHPENDRVVVHIAGSEAGLMRLDIELTDVQSAEDVSRFLRLNIPGEESPLKPTGVMREHDHFVVSFFSSDIANAGHLPARAVATWKAPDQAIRSFPVAVESADKVSHAEGNDAVEIPGGDPVVVYPATVGLMAILALAIGVIAAFAALLIN